MKMVKSLLLGTAAGLVAMTGAQAADLPVKAKPVQYVKICSLYGAGFYYIPGTDTCLKIGGWVRYYTDWNANGNLTNGALVADGNSRTTSNLVARVRGYITADARTQTAYGTLRSYIAVGLSNRDNTAAFDDPTGKPGFSANRAFIQLAGFTFGITQSFYDFHNTPATSYFGGSINPSSDSGDGGKQLAAYTAQFGNGLSASVSWEGQRNQGVWYQGSQPGAFGTGFIPSTGSIGTPPLLLAAGVTVNQKGTQWLDVVGNLRIDQVWGSAQIMGALHDTSGTYYGTNSSFGNPADAVGFAVGAGIKLFAPMVGPGDYFSAQVNYAVGATGYVNNAASSYGYENGGAGGNLGFGVGFDAVYGGTVAGLNTTGIEKTTAFGVNAAFEHFWSKSWQTSLYGAYTEYTYSDLANRMMCQSEGVGTGALGSLSAIAPGFTCNNNFAVWGVGTRTQWNVDSSTYIGLDVMYQGLNSAQIGPGLVPTPGLSGQPAALRTVQDQHTWVTQFRVHRNFYP